jgi:SsrA-binding protein
MPKGTDSKVLANNKRASFDYPIEDTIEAGLVLTGTEIKSVRKGKISIGDAFVRFDGGEAILWNSNIAHFEQGNRYNHDQLRPRKLLLH